MKSTKKSVLVTIACLVFSAPLPSFAQVLPPIDRLAVFDGNETRVGPVVGLEGGFIGPIAWILVPLVVDNFFGIAGMRNNQFYGVSDVFFSSTDCTGQPLMLTQQEAGISFEETFAVVGDGTGTGNVIWKPDPNSTPFQAGTIVKSVIQKGNKECASGPLASGSTDIVNAIQVINLDNIFTPPFKLQPEVGGDLGAIQNQIDALETQVGGLSEENAFLLQNLRGLAAGFKNHTHNYRTGRGPGHNNTVAESSKTNLP